MTGNIHFHSVKIINKNTENAGQGPCRVKEEYPLDGMCQKMTSLTNVLQQHILM